MFKRFLLAVAFALTLATAAAGPALAGTCVSVNLITHQCDLWAPEPPAGGRYCDYRGNTTINSGEMALYTGTNYGGYCVVVPGNWYPTLPFMNGWNIGSIVNKRTGYPAPPVSQSFSGTSYGGSNQSLPNGSYPSLSFPPLSLKVN